MSKYKSCVDCGYTTGKGGIGDDDVGEPCVVCKEILQGPISYFKPKIAKPKWDNRTLTELVDRIMRGDKRMIKGVYTLSWDKVFKIIIKMRGEK
jgi:hypothetical protein